MTTNFSLSLRSISSQILALEALRIATTPNCDSPAILTSDHLSALHRSIRGAYARMLLSLSGSIIESNIADLDDNSELLVFSMEIPESFHAPTLRKMIEEALVNLTLAVCLPSPAKESASAIAEELLRRVSSTVNNTFSDQITLKCYDI
ncbi:MAG: hypothetical protein K2M01_03725 [Paramuribaculum sp.]|nr:hypothetical protein [Paramuribaculum sp.]